MHLNLRHGGTQFKGISIEVGHAGGNFNGCQLQTTVECAAADGLQATRGQLDRGQVEALIESGTGNGGDAFLDGNRGDLRVIGLPGDGGAHGAIAADGQGAVAHQHPGQIAPGFDDGLIQGNRLNFFAARAGGHIEAADIAPDVGLGAFLHAAALGVLRCHIHRTAGCMVCIIGFAIAADLGYLVMIVAQAFVAVVSACTYTFEIAALIRMLRMMLTDIILDGSIANHGNILQHHTQHQQKA